ncbi:MAG: hypothetical protein FVQ82_11185 [Planctomycetes bacterium]|nr:hypothetical protein [Planctomycetota bacterium]
MRILFFLSIVVLAVSGCASSGVCMYSVPKQGRNSMRPQKMQVNKQIAYRPTISKRQQIKEYSSRQKKESKPIQKSKPNRKKKTGKKKGILNDAMGVSVKLLKEAYRQIKPKLPKIPGF